MSWYLVKDWVDQEDGIERVVIRYALTPPSQSPNWSWRHESRELFDLGGRPHRRAKVLKMPREVWDLDNGWATPQYRLHYFFEVLQHGQWWTTDLSTDEIVYKDLEYVDEEHVFTHLCVFWGVGGWTAPVYSPMDDPRVPADSEYTGPRYYGYEDKERFHYEKARLLGQLEGPLRWQGRIWGPQGSTALQQYHIGRLYPSDTKAEGYLGPDGLTAEGGDHWVHEL